VSTGAPSPDTPQHHWVKCLVRVVGERNIELTCDAKLRCDDVIDALDLSRWGAVAFQHLWRSGHSRHAPRELSQALWYLKRATGQHNPEAKTAARLIHKLVEIADNGNASLRDVLLQFAKDAEMAEFSATDLLHTCTQES
jgi:hypothetical protein